MKNKRASGSLFGLLARQYLLFSVTLLAIAAVVFVLWGLAMAWVWASSPERATTRPWSVRVS